MISSPGYAPLYRQPHRKTNALSTISRRTKNSLSATRPSRRPVFAQSRRAGAHTPLFGKISRPTCTRSRSCRPCLRPSCYLWRAAAIIWPVSEHIGLSDHYGRLATVVSNNALCVCNWLFERTNGEMSGESRSFPCFLSMSTLVEYGSRPGC